VIEGGNGFQGKRSLIGKKRKSQEKMTFKGKGSKYEGILKKKLNKEKRREF